MVRTVSTSLTRIITEPQARTARRTVPVAPKPTSRPVLSVRRLGTPDLSWVQAWTTKLGLPMPRSERVRQFVLLEDRRRVGYLAGRPSMLNLGNGREPVMWVVGTFLIPARRNKGLIPKYGELLTRQEYPEGKLAARVAVDNTRMHGFMASGRWKKLRATRHYVEYVLELKAPYRPNRRR